jgi:hypothetical protein
MRRPIVTTLVACNLVTLLLLPSRAGSEPAARFPAEQPVAVTARVASLEQRMQGLEQRLKAFEKLAVRPQPGGGYVLTANGARILVGRDGSVEVSPGGSARTGYANDDPCDPPYNVGVTGIRSIKPECLEEPFKHR